MRHVILQENARLREQIRSQREEVSRLAERVSPCTATQCDAGSVLSESIARWVDVVGSRDPEPCLLSAPRRRRIVEWHVRGLDGHRAAELGQCDRSIFELPEYPGATFAFTFGARGGALGSASATPELALPGVSRPCRLKLRLSGPGSEGLCLRVALEAEARTKMPESGGATASRGLEGDGRTPTSSGGLCGDESTLSESGSCSITLLGQSEEILLYGGQRAACTCTWPTEARALIVCRVRIHFAGFANDHAEPLRLDSVHAGVTPEVPVFGALAASSPASPCAL